MGNYLTRVYDIFTFDKGSRKRKMVEIRDDEDFSGPEVKRFENQGLKEF